VLPAELVVEAFPNIRGAAAALTEWSLRAQTEGHAPSTMFAYVRHTDPDAVALAFGTRERWLREDATCAETFASTTGDELVVMISEGAKRFVVMLGEFESEFGLEAKNVE